MVAPFLVPAYAAAAVGLWLVARPYGNPRWKLAATGGVLSAGLALLTDQAITGLWERPRPYAAHPAATHLLAAASSDPSFPSDHAAAAFAIAVAVLAFSRWAGAAFLAAASFIAASRVALGLHYPSDVVVGALIGALSAVLVVQGGGPWLGRLVVLGSRFSDPALLRARQALERRRTRGDRARSA